MKIAIIDLTRHPEPPKNPKNMISFTDKCYGPVAQQDRASDS